MENLSSLAVDSMWVTSQAAGNMMSSNAKAMTAPGSQPVDVLVDRNNPARQDPTIDLGTETPPSTTGKPDVTNSRWTAPGEPAWTKTTTPDVVRRQPAIPPSAERKN